ncbi:hypothetical protein DH2020_028543 [Rehmannia glutinosa]|uniref:Alpha-glucosidase n=1 Tax=Rehmannia glutinosa TaxID=99300 RepID=A0ABR0VR28_REHGL
MDYTLNKREELDTFRCNFKMSERERGLLRSKVEMVDQTALFHLKEERVKKMAGCEEISLNSNLQSRKMVYEPIHEEGVFRFDCSVDARCVAFPSISFQNPIVRERPIKNVTIVPTYVPTFEHEINIAADITTFESEKGLQIVNLMFPPSTSFYGTGEVSGPLERTGKKIETWNTDAYQYGAKNTSLYQSHPWVLAVLPDGKAIGVLADTTRRCEIDLHKSSNIKFTSSWPYPVITFGPFASPTDVLASFSRAVGTIFMPPKWALGYHQCRFSYYSEEEVNEEGFYDPKSFVDSLHQKGFRAIWVLDPGIKNEKGYFAYDSGSESNVWTQTADGRPFVGVAGPCVFPDFTRSEVRSWWAKLVKNFISNGVDGLWNDMNEPSIMVVKVYGMLMAKSTYKGMKLANRHKRPFVLSRAGFVGSQRYAATWTGDNTSDWEHLQMSIPMVLNLGLSGQPFSGPDIGGFIGNATPKLFQTWMGIGSMFPFCRGHSEKGTNHHEPWFFGEECEKVCRLALQRRYRILPLLYTLFYLAHTRGIPVATPTFFADPTDFQLRTQENSFLLGPLLVYARVENNHELCITKPKLPEGIWLSFDFEDSHPDLPKLYLKGGSIIPVAPPHEYVDEANPTDDLTLIVALDERGKAEGLLYEDDGDGYEYSNGGYLLTTYVARQHCSTVTVKVSKAEGSWKRPKRHLHVKLLLGEGAMIVGIQDKTYFGIKDVDINFNPDFDEN